MLQWKKSTIAALRNMEENYGADTAEDLTSDQAG